MIIGVNRDTIQRNVLLQLYELLGFNPPGTKCTETKIFGRNVYFVGAHDESAVRRIQGSTLAMAYVDEATCIPEPFWRMLLSRLSVSGAQLLATANPDGPAHWLKKQFIDRSHELDLAVWNFQLDDNPSLDEKYKASLKQEYTGMWYKRYILGEWALAHGLIYDGFDDDNVYDHPKEPPNYYIVGIDYGTTNATAAVLCGIRPNRWPHITVEEEFYYDSAKAGRSKADDELAEDIRSFVAYKNVSAIYVDPAAASFKVALRQQNLPVLDANNDVINGIKTASKFISNKSIVIQKGCKTLLEHIQSYAWDSKAADRGEDKPVKVNDHICVTRDTIVTTNRGLYHIDRVNKRKKGKEHYTILSWTGSTFEMKTCGESEKTGEKKKIFRLTLENGKTLKATPDHQIMTNFGYIEIQSLLFTDHVLCYCEKNAGIYSAVKSIEECENEDVYCISVPSTGNFVANGMVVKNCDALRYAVYSAFPRGEFSHPDENISYDQLRKKVFGNNDCPLMGDMGGGYF